MPPTYYQSGRFPPDKQLDWIKLIPDIGPAAAALARYDGVLSAVPNPAVLLAPLITDEAVLSSRIEGTQATIDEVLHFEVGSVPESPSRRDDIVEILNYRAAMRKAVDLLEELPLSQRVIKQAHKVLLRGVRGEGKSPGEYRKIPNWIGPPGCSMDEARFVPIGADMLPDAMGAWEHYIHADTLDKLVQLAILHAEFEAIHPFLDGNGRLGRMFVPLFLWQTKLIREPMFYISAYFEENRDAYYEGLFSVSRDNDWTGWCRFFLKAVRLQAEYNLERAQSIIDLYNTMKSEISSLLRSQHVIFTLDCIFEQSFFRSTHFISKSNIPKSSARRILNTLCESQVLNIIRESQGNQPAVLAFPKLLNIIQSRKV